MSGTGWILLILGGAAAYLLIKGTGATYSANPLGNIMNKPITPLPPGLTWQWNGFQWVTGAPGATQL